MLSKKSEKMFTNSDFLFSQLGIRIEHNFIVSVFIAAGIVYLAFTMFVIIALLREDREIKRRSKEEALKKQ